MLSTDKLKKRRATAKKEFDASAYMRDEAYRYAIPFRRSTKDSGTGENRVDQVFDHTAIDSAFRFAGKYQQDHWPPGQENFALEPGPLVFDPKEREKLTKSLAPIGQVLQAFFDNGDWDMALHEMALDLTAGTGAMLLNPSAEPDGLWEPISVPVDEVLLEQGPNNKITGIFWTRKMPVRVLFETWPEGKYSPALKKLLQDKPEEEIEVNVDTVWEARKGRARTGRWKMLVWTDKQGDVVFESQSRTCPWLTPRYFRVPGETWGRGPIMLAMPTIKTLNTAARLQLQAAAIAMLGIYTAVDDGVFNPDLSELAPGAFWKVARNSGSTLGPSVSRFPDPRLDLSGLVVENMQMGVKAVMMDNALPTDSSAVKSPTEILERVKRLASDHLGAFGRQVKELVIPAVQRAMELAYEKGVIRNNVPLDQLLVRVRIKSPLAIAREAQRIEKIINWLQMVLAITAATGNPGGAARIAEIDLALVEIGRKLGVPEHLITSEDRRKEIDDNTAKQQQAQMAMMMAMGKMPPGMGGAA